MQYFLPKSSKTDNCRVKKKYFPAFYFIVGRQIVQAKAYYSSHYNVCNATEKELVLLQHSWNSRLLKLR